MKTFVAIASVLALTAGASATITGVALGPGARPASLGSFAMTTFGDDTRPLFSDETGVGVADGAPFGGITFSSPANHRQIGAGWATWSGTYTGDVYYTNGATSITVGLPAGTGAFYLYAEPNPFAVFEITATAQDGTSISQFVDGSAGAAGYGFFSADGVMQLASITVSSSVDFAIGEFAIARIPAPGAAALAGIVGLAGLRRRR